MSYAANHQLMTDSRAWKVANIVNDIPDLEVSGDEDADILVLGWGRPSDRYVPPPGGVRLDHAGKVATLHLRHLNPMPQNLGEILHRYDKILIPELNTGQLRKVIRAEFLVDAKGLNKVAGEPFKISEITERSWR